VPVVSPVGAQWKCSQSSCDGEAGAPFEQHVRPHRPALNVTFREPSRLMLQLAAPCNNRSRCSFQGGGEARECAKVPNDCPRVNKKQTSSFFDVLYVRALFSDVVARSHLKVFLCSQHNKGEPIKTITVVPFDKALGSQLSEDVSWLIHTRRARIPGSEGRKATMNLPLCALLSLLSRHGLITWLVASLVPLFIFSNE